MKRKLSFLIIVGFFFYVPSLLAKEIVVKGMSYPLGSGYNTRTEQFVGQCAVGPASNQVAYENTVTHGTMSLSQEIDERVIASKLGFEAGGRARVGLFEGSFSASYFNEAHSSSLSLSFNYSADYFQSSHLVTPSTKVVSGMGNYSTNSIQWFDHCGDEYVYSQDQGAQLMINMRVDFVSSEEKNRFSAQFGAKGPLFSMQGKVDEVRESYSKQTKMTLSAFQLGGDPSQLGSLFSPQGASSGREEAKKVMSCSFGELTQCLEVMTNMIDYATNQETGFPHQIRNFSHYVLLKLRTRPWRYLTSVRSPIPPREESLKAVEATRQTLQGLFEENYQLWVEASRYLKMEVPRLSQDLKDGRMGQKEKMKHWVDRLRNHLSEISKGIHQCYDQPTFCEDSLKQVKEKIGYGDSKKYPTQKAILDLLIPETYAQFCDLKKSDRELHRTIQVLDELAFQLSGLSDRAEWEKGDSCLKGEEILIRLDELDLSEKALVDVRPIGTLRRLQKLNLRGNHIQEVQPLGTLSRLTHLDLSDNRIQEVEGLASLSSAIHINLQGNQLKAVQSLSSLSKLETLDLRRNKGGLRCSLTESSLCKLKDFSSSAQFSEVYCQSIPFQECFGMAVCSGINQEVVFLGGKTNSEDYSSHAFVLEAGNQKLCSGERLKRPRVGHTATLLQDPDQILVVGGDRIGSSFEIYSFSQRKTLHVGELEASRVGHTTTLMGNGQVVIGGGWREGVLSSSNRTDGLAEIEIFDPASREVRTLKKGLSQPKAHHAAIALGEDRVLFSGGIHGSKVFNQVELLQNESGEFILKRPQGVRLQIPRFYHTMTLLPDGKIFIAGGFGPDLKALSSVEIYDPEKGSITLLDREMDHVRGGHAATLLQDRWVLLAGGAFHYTGGLGSQNPDQKSTHLAEVFDTLTGNFIPIGSMNHPRSFFSLGTVWEQHTCQVFLGPSMGSVGSLRSFECLDAQDLY